MTINTSHLPRAVAQAVVVSLIVLSTAGCRPLEQDGGEVASSFRNGASKIDGAPSAELFPTGRDNATVENEPASAHNAAEPALALSEPQVPKRLRIPKLGVDS